MPFGIEVEETAPRSDGDDELEWALEELMKLL